jgi:predicted ATPase/class 3 adenylate cyclase
VADLPSGTVTLLFSDMEGATVLLSRLGAAYADALDGQRRVLRAVWGAHGGTELGTEGDSFYVVFPTAEHAVVAAAQAQRDLAEYPWPAGEKVRVRIGVHTGSPLVHDDAYVGMDVHRAARISGSAHGGQVVVSSATAELVRECLPDGVRLRDLGHHRLRDIPAPEHLWQLCIDGLQAKFAPLKTVGAVSSLPRPATPLVGRDGELAELTAELGSSNVRLMTLTGPGGSGKTRLALGVAQRLVEAFADGVFFVPLAAVAAADVMWTSIGEVLDVPPEGRTPTGFLAHIAHRDALLVLDNLEQVAGAAGVVSELAAAAPAVVVLVTSRRPLHLAGEHEHPVPPLELPDEATVQGAERSGAVQQFVQHARMVRPSFTLTDDNAADVVQICKALDGLPLAIELAAARIKLLSPRALLARLDTALDIAATGIRPTRQQTVRQTIAWSYDLLPATQQAFFRQLGVFQGGASLGAVAAVTSAVTEGPGANMDPLDLAADLVDASLVTIGEDADGEPRFGLLETVRMYALDELRSAGELHEAQRRHAEYFATIAESAARGVAGNEQLPWIARLSIEDDNLRAALNWSTDPDGDADIATRLGGALWHFWEISGTLTEGRRWLDRIMALDAPVTPEARLELLAGAGTLAWAQGDYNRATQTHARALSLSRDLNDQAAEAFALNNLSAQCIAQGDYEHAEPLCEQAGALALSIGEERIAAMTWHNSAEIALHRADDARAIQLYENALATFRRLGDLWLVAASLRGLAATALHLGDDKRSMDALQEGIRLSAQVGENSWMAEQLEGLAEVAEHAQQPFKAARLLGAADSLRHRIGSPMEPANQEHNATLISALRSQLSADFARAWEGGQRLTTSQAIEEGCS